VFRDKIVWTKVSGLNLTQATMGCVEVSTVPTYWFYVGVKGLNIRDFMTSRPAWAEKFTFLGSVQLCRVTPYKLALQFRGHSWFLGVFARFSGGPGLWDCGPFVVQCFLGKILPFYVR
jgi:hypothetical protein